MAPNCRGHVMDNDGRFSLAACGEGVVLDADLLEGADVPEGVYLSLRCHRSIFLWRVHDKDQGLLSGDDRRIWVAHAMGIHGGGSDALGSGVLWKKESRHTHGCPQGAGYGNPTQYHQGHRIWD